METFFYFPLVFKLTTGFKTIGCGWISFLSSNLMTMVRVIICFQLLWTQRWQENGWIQFSVSFHFDWISAYVEKKETAIFMRHTRFVMMTTKSSCLWILLDMWWHTNERLNEASEDELFLKNSMQHPYPDLISSHKWTIQHPLLAL